MRVWISVSVRADRIRGETAAGFTRPHLMSLREAAASSKPAILGTANRPPRPPRGQGEEQGHRRDPHFWRGRLLPLHQPRCPSSGRVGAHPRTPGGSARKPVSPDPAAGSARRFRGGGGSVPPAHEMGKGTKGRKRAPSAPRKKKKPHLKNNKSWSKT